MKIMEATKQVPFYYTVGAEIEISFNGEWVLGNVISGYRFRDGIITMITQGGKKIWCPEAREDLYRRPVESQEGQQE